GWKKPVILVLNKSDLPPAFTRDELDPSPYLGVYEISAQTGAGVDELMSGLVAAVLAGGVPAAGTFLLLDAWEQDLLRRTGDALARAAAALESGVTPDIVAEELRVAYREAGKLQGIDVSEDILSHIFSRFCVGK
ncbi:tRNA uridine-5-carboxymethylaminomethyl(34) synthesis GTPase MnmE, partial [Candidatus Acetothermia bacterium]